MSITDERFLRKPLVKPGELIRCENPNHMVYAGRFDACKRPVHRSQQPQTFRLALESNDISIGI